MIHEEESGHTWSNFFESPKQHGLQGTELIISEAHKGDESQLFVNHLSMLGGKDVRCIFLRNIFSSIPKKHSLDRAAQPNDYLMLS